MLVLEGQGSDYHGEAVNPANLSLFELALGYHKVPLDTSIWPQLMTVAWHATWTQHKWLPVPRSPPVHLSRLSPTCW